MGTTYHYAIGSVSADGQTGPWSSYLVVTIPAQEQTSQPQLEATTTPTATATSTATATPTVTATPGATATPTTTPTATPTVNASSATDRAALVALYNATDGANWETNTNWNSTEPIGDWYGVTTNANGRVTRLYLVGNELDGSIPSALGNLSYLVYLSFGSNDLSGSIPSQLGNLSNLEKLFLERNELSGSIPSQLGSLSSLLVLALAENGLTGSLPTTLANLSNLETFDVKDNELSGSIPIGMGPAVQSQQRPPRWQQLYRLHSHPVEKLLL